MRCCSSDCAPCAASRRAWKAALSAPSLGASYRASYRSYRARMSLLRRSRCRSSRARVHWAFFLGAGASAASCELTRLRFSMPHHLKERQAARTMSGIDLQRCPAQPEDRCCQCINLILLLLINVGLRGSVGPLQGGGSVSGAVVCSQETETVGSNPITYILF